MDTPETNSFWKYGDCGECGKTAAIVTRFGSVCAVCLPFYNAKLRAEREAANAAASCEICHVKTGGPDICQECCGENGHEIDADEGFMCLHCNYEGAEDFACAAYDRWKASRYE